MNDEKRSVWRSAFEVAGLIAKGSDAISEVKKPPPNYGAEKVVKAGVNTYEKWDDVKNVASYVNEKVVTPENIERVKNTGKALYKFGAFVVNIIAKK